MFWSELDNKKEDRDQIVRRINLDGIRLIKNTPEKIIEVKKTAPTSPFKIVSTFIFALILLALSFSGAIGVSAVKQKANVFKLFRQGKYLVVFQNNSEMRPTGGFIGSFAIITFQDYKIKKIDFNTNIFKLDNAYTTKTQIFPPKPLARVAQDHWALRDSNFAVDFPTAANDIQWFLEQESGQKVDGVIAVNASLIQDLLRLTGPVYLSKYQTNITADNFFNELAQKIEKEYFSNLENQAENEPKTILKDLMPILMEKSLTISKTKLANLLSDALTQKQIIFQSNDPKLEQAIIAVNWGGAIEETDSDYLAVNNANFTDTLSDKNAGAKTSLKIKEAIDYQVEEKEGQLVGNLTITRSHMGSYAWPDGVNTNWTRILVPEGADLKTAELNGQDIVSQVELGSEAGKTTFATWINTAPQTSNVLKLTYTLPISTKNYSLLIQKQPGNLGDDLKVSLKNKVLFKGLFNEDKLIK